ncbi:hypothetical protein [Rhodococcus sp. BP-318]|nr:hypothetical protein [Rhodococcus sp. BP-318]MBY6424174.1 hypothetical protein [Rhodococcus sp. BP-324]MBY6448332.1 hypothetical protein [Rhodococcus sp. BP-318]MBY6467773.1 hypothetical protein [Rhodococcus sp. BP-290]MBY6574885.1 hypothetical protein [Rhodococcus sp. BP-253]
MWQRHHAIATTLASAGHKVVFVEPHPRGVKHVANWLASKAKKRIRRTKQGPGMSHKVPNGIEIISWSPFQFVRQLINLSSPRTQSRSGDLLVVAYLPSMTTRRAIERLSPDFLIYDSVLDWSAVPKSFFPPADFSSFEKWVSRLARSNQALITTDSAVVAGRYLVEKTECHVVYPAADEEFRTFPATSGNRAGIERDVLGYFGSVRYDEIDVEKINELAMSYEVRIAGELDDEATRKLSSEVAFLGPMELPDLVRQIALWDGIILPYRESARSKTLMPAKIWNAVATGLPLYASHLTVPPELVHHFEDIATLHSSDASRVNGKGTKPLRDVPTWEMRVGGMLNLLEDRGRYGHK